MSKILDDLVEFVVDRTAHITVNMTPEDGADYVSALVVRLVGVVDEAGSKGNLGASDFCRRLADEIRALPDA